MNTVSRLASILFVCALSACSDGDRHKAKTKPTITAEQSACFQAVMKKQSDYIIANSKRRAELMLAGQSTIDLTLQERRMEEQFCLEELKCFGTKDTLAIGLQFESCLRPTAESDG